MRSIAPRRPKAYRAVPPLRGRSHLAIVCATAPTICRFARPRSHQGGRQSGRRPRRVRPRSNDFVDMRTTEVPVSRLPRLPAITTIWGETMQHQATLLSMQRYDRGLGRRACPGQSRLWLGRSVRWAALRRSDRGGATDAGTVSVTTDYAAAARDNIGELEYGAPAPGQNG